MSALTHPASHDDSVDNSDTVLFDLRVTPYRRFDGPISTPALGIPPIRAQRQSLDYSIELLKSTHVS